MLQLAQQETQNSGKNRASDQGSVSLLLPYPSVKIKFGSTKWYPNQNLQTLAYYLVKVVRGSKWWFVYG